MNVIKRIEKLSPQLINAFYHPEMLLQNQIPNITVAFPEATFN